MIATTESELFCSLSVSETRLIVRSFVARSGVGGFTATDEAVLTHVTFRASLASAPLGCVSITSCYVATIDADTLSVCVESTAGHLSTAEC